MGMRNCISVLSESYSYLDLKDRTNAQRAFVMETLNALIRHADTTSSLSTHSDAMLKFSGPIDGPTLKSGAKPVETTIMPVLLGSVTAVQLPDGLGTRYVANPTYEEKSLNVSVDFVASRETAMPYGWVIIDPSSEVTSLLARHGLNLSILDEDLDAQVEAFEISGLSRSPAKFQGHEMVRLKGEFKPLETALPKGTLIVSARQPLGRLAGDLLDPLSDDSFFTWNVFDQELAKGAKTASESKMPHRAPVLRLRSIQGAVVSKMTLHPTEESMPGLLPLWDGKSECQVQITVHVVEPGKRKADRDYELGATWEDRILSFRWNDQTFAITEALLAALKEQSRDCSVLIHQSKAVVQGDIDTVAKALGAAGFKKVRLAPYEE
jgi:hypothetical protein